MALQPAVRHVIAVPLQSVITLMMAVGVISRSLHVACPQRARPASLANVKSLMSNHWNNRAHQCYRMHISPQQDARLQVGTAPVAVGIRREVIQYVVITAAKKVASLFMSQGDMDT